MFHPGEWVLIPSPLTSSGSHQNMFGWKTGGTHPTGMFSCFQCFETENEQDARNISTEVTARTNRGIGGRH